jgi:hypothetical protein
MIVTELMIFKAVVVVVLAVLQWVVELLNAALISDFKE